MCKVMFLENKMAALQHVSWNSARDPQWTAEWLQSVLYIINKNFIN